MHVIAKGKGRKFGIEYLSLRLAPSYVRSVNLHVQLILLAKSLSVY